MKLILAIDIGNSKTEYLLADRFGQVVGNYIGEGANYQAKGSEESIGIISNGVKTLLKKSNISPDTLEFVYIGAAGADSPQDYENLDEIFNSIFKDTPFSFDNDGIISLKNGIVNKPGMVITCGTGNTNYALNSKGETFRLGGFCMELGDVLGMETIAKRVTHRAARSCDTRDYPSLLPDAIKDKLGLKTFFTLINYNLESEIVPHIISSFLEVCEKGDGLALEIAWEITKEVVTITEYFYNMAFSPNEHFRLVLDGYIFREDNPVYKMIKNAVSVKFNADIIIPDTPPVFGAFYYAMEELGHRVDDKITLNLKETYKEGVKL